MVAPPLNDDFVDLLAAFVEHGVKFVLVGAHAMAAHGVVRATGDMDVLVCPDAANALRVLNALASFGAPVEAHGLGAADFARPGNVYQMGLPPRRIDVLTSISGVTFDEIWASRSEIEVQGVTIGVIGRDELIRNKQASARPKDLLDVELLREAMVPGPDRARE